MKNDSDLFLDNQLCFPFYATSRLITRLYQPLLKKIDLTYPQYLVMLVLWESDSIIVSQLGKRLFLNSNTLTPLLKKMEQKGLLIRKRSNEDERTVVIELTSKGQKLKTKATGIPNSLKEQLNINMPMEDILELKKSLWKFLGNFETIQL